MNRTKLKNYAPEARREFIQAVTDRAALYGLTAKKTEPMIGKGDVVLIDGKPFPKTVSEKRTKLEARIKQIGFEHTMEAMAYTWFNRLVAIRFMELHGYLEHGFRVLSHPERHTQPEILEKAQHVDLPGLDQKKVIALKLDGTKEEELYRLLLTAQCNALHTAMPFLFEMIDDETELLLPDNLLHSDSLIRRLVNEIEEEDWQEVEIIGWIYQFYISEKKDEVIGSVVASEDIPAATQLFTPNWIVKYLVQNTLGRQWLATYPQSALRQQMQYYIEPAEQTPEVQAQLKAITPTSLNPEELTLLDPACGSGHILVEAYDLFKAIYQERGYRAKDIPALILQKNLFGLEIDDRAAQLAAFALMMKARADDRNIFDSGMILNILAFEDSKGLSAADITEALNSPILKEEVPHEHLFEEINEAKAGLFSHGSLAIPGNVSHGDIASLLELFENAKTFGSLIQVSPKLAAKLPEIEQRLNDVVKYGDLTHASACAIRPLLRQAAFITAHYDAVVANPPYMGSKGMNGLLGQFAKESYRHSKDNLFAMFMECGCRLARPTTGFVSMVVLESWMFLTSYERFRRTLLSDNLAIALAHMPYEGRGRTTMGIAFGTVATVLRRISSPAYRSDFMCIRHTEIDEECVPYTFPVSNDRKTTVAIGSFQKVPGAAIAYWISENARNKFVEFRSIRDHIEPQVGLQTSDNPRFIRFWHEVGIHRIGFRCGTNEAAQQSGRKWFPIDKGGDYRKWFGNNEHVVNWEANGSEIKAYVASRYPYLKGNTDYVVKDRGFFFRPGVTWNKITSAEFSARASFEGSLFSDAGMKLICNDQSDLFSFLGFLNSSVSTYLLEAISPTMNCEKGTIATLPFIAITGAMLGKVQRCVEVAQDDWNSFEMSWDFEGSPLLTRKVATVEAAYKQWNNTCLDRIRTVAQNELELNEHYVAVYGLTSELSPVVTEDHVALNRADREEDIRRLLSYAIGCMMGRFSLDKPGLIYAHSGNVGFDPDEYKSYRADDDGIIPLFDSDWGIRDDAANRFVEFIGVAWPKEHLDENLKFVADSLGPTTGEQPPETIRRYLTTGFYKHHLSMYKKRPIYWLFSSGKTRAFQCLVYLHRYNEGTLSRMRTEYVIPLMGKMNARLEHLQGSSDQKGQGGEIAAATSATVRRKLEKERDTVKKQIVELQGFDAKLRHYADQRIKLDLDDGVKVNYGKFSDPKYGDILADVKAIAGGSADE